MWNIAGLRPATLSHKHGLYWLSHMWFFWWNRYWLKMSLDESVIGWEIHWMKKFLDECSLDENCVWMKLSKLDESSLDESVSGWNRFGWKCILPFSWIQAKFAIIGHWLFRKFRRGKSIVKLFLTFCKTKRAQVALTLQTPPKFTRRTPREREKERNGAGEE